MFRMRRIGVLDQYISYYERRSDRTTGRGTVLVIPGPTSPAELWQGVVERIPARMLFIVDLCELVYGAKQDCTAPRLSTKELVKYLAEWLSRVTLRPPLILVTSQLGTLLALDWALDRPEDEMIRAIIHVVSLPVREIQEGKLRISQVHCYGGEKSDMFLLYQGLTPPPQKLIMCWLRHLQDTDTFSIQLYADICSRLSGRKHRFVVHQIGSDTCTTEGEKDNGNHRHTYTVSIDNGSPFPGTEFPRNAANLIESRVLESVGDEKYLMKYLLLPPTKECDDLEIGFFVC